MFMAIPRKKKANPTGHSYSPEAKKRAMKKYSEKMKTKYQKIEFRSPIEKRLKEQIEFHIAQTGESMAAFLARAINETIDSDCYNNNFKSLVPREWEKDDDFESELPF